MTARLRVVLADDHPVYLNGLARLLTDLGGFDVVGLAVNGAEAIALVADHRPDVVAMDLRMPGIDGVEAIRQIVAAHPDTGVVALTMFDDDALLHAAIRAGARGYLLKDADDTQIARALTSIASGESVFGEAPAHRLLAAIAGQPLRRTVRPLPQLTGREFEIVELMARGLTNQEIANTLYLSERTARNYVSNIFTKLGVDNRAQAITLARDLGVGDRP